MTAGLRFERGQIIMKGNAKLIETLNALLADELGAINQYIVHAEMCENWGYKKQSAASKKQAIDEMKHAEALIERLLFLEGKPNLSKYQKLNIGQTVPGGSVWVKGNDQ